MTDSILPAIGPTIRLHDGAAIPQLGLGVYKVPEPQTADLVAGALRRGYRHVDTAALYLNERGVGEGIRASGLPREEVFVTTKVWNDAHGLDETRRAFDASMALLGLETLDLYLIHWPAPTQDRYVDAWRAMIALRDEGRVRSIGVSNFEPHHVQRLVDETGVVPVVNQVELHPHLPQTAVRQANAAFGIVTESWSPLARGQMLAEGSRDLAVLSAIGERHGRSAAQVALRWHVQQGLVVIPKSTSLRRVEENSALFGWELTVEEMAEIATLETGARTGRHPDDLD
ncbi:MULTISPECIES: aldo/keto reductase [unclassified Microcella]|uniref:aldo/keto reductase n=1 Tax=unclassified Microcella TaxID=2630066 RepID=UPI0006FFEE28|nr:MULTISPECIES: aldo/keto reductase [unclassified Microcella]KQV26304.1 oxidoreductase [Yonghaparkia sp. Root332]KRF32912.1 oxidoreductase [Yonghaparkia sp. Soil809]